MFGTGQTTAAVGRLAGLPDGRYLAGFRPNHLDARAARRGRGRAFTATVTVTEITGSETFVHVDHAGDRWVGLAHGIHDLRAGRADRASISTRRTSSSSARTARLVAPAAYALAA